MEIPSSIETFFVETAYGRFHVEATGAGNTAASLVEAAGRAIEQGIVVAFTTRCASGAASAAELIWPMPISCTKEVSA